MKKILPLLSILSLFGYKGPGPTKNQPAGDATQKIELTVDGSKKTADSAPLISSGYSGSHFMLGYLSEKDDVQFTVSAYMQDLKEGSYQVYDCNSASECNDQVPDNNQTVLYGPSVKDPVPPSNLFRIAYYAPKLGLQPLTLVITSVKDEQQAGNPFKTKRVEGHFSGGLAAVEQEKGGYEWHVVKATKVEGVFSVICSMR